MSYCVNCGVELEKSQQHCPLCGVEAINPKEPYNEQIPRPYSMHLVRVQKRLERHYIALTLTVLLALAIAICVMADMVYANAISWSLYVVASLLLVWVLFVLPLLYTGLHPVIVILMDICALLMFLYVFNHADPSTDWYFSLAMPQVLLYGFLALIDVLGWRSKLLRGWQRIGIIVMSIGVAMMGLEALLDLYNDMHVELDWSWFVIIPAFAIGLLFFLLEHKREVKEEILKRLRV